MSNSSAYYKILLKYSLLGDQSQFHFSSKSKPHVRRSETKLRERECVYLRERGREREKEGEREGG